MIQRDFYLNQLIERKNNGLIKIITGIRRCGKSFLLNTLFYNHLIESGIENDHIIKLAFDSAEDLERIGEDLVAMNKEKRGADPKLFMSYIRSKTVDSGTYYLLLDEIQNLDSFVAVLNSYMRHDNYDIYVTGSNSKMLSSDVSTEFRGRGDEIKIHPLSFSEYYSSVDLDYDDAIEQYMTFGGLPLVYSYSSDSAKSNYLTSLFNTTYIKDVVERNGIKNDEQIKILVDILASSIGSLTNRSKIANTFKSVRNDSTYSSGTIQNHIRYLTDAFIIEEAKRYDVKGRKYISTNPKYYFSDIGLRNARLNFRQQEPTHILENIVYNELCIRGYNVDVGVVELNCKDENGKSFRKSLEVDFVVNKASQRYYIQVAYDLSSPEKQEQEFASLKNIPDSFKKIVIVNGSSKPWRNESGFVIMGMKYFLLNQDSLEI